MLTAARRKKNEQFGKIQFTRPSDTTRQIVELVNNQLKSASVEWAVSTRFLLPVGAICHLSGVYRGQQLVALVDFDPTRCELPAAELDLQRHLLSAQYPSVPLLRVNSLRRFDPTAEETAQDLAEDLLAAEKEARSAEAAMALDWDAPEMVKLREAQEKNLMGLRRNNKIPKYTV